MRRGDSSRWACKRHPPPALLPGQVAGGELGWSGAEGDEQQLMAAAARAAHTRAPGQAHTCLLWVHSRLSARLEQFI